MRKKLLLGALTAFGLTLTMQVTAQHDFKCGTAERLRKLYAENPGMEEEFYSLMNSNKKTSTDAKGNKTTVYTIPVVFHIVHEYGLENISDAQVKDQMRILNLDYRKLNADTSAIIPAFDTLAGDARIEFKLPSIDPWGNCTNGIEHIYSHLANGGDDYSKLHQWNRSKYLNVWVVNSIGEAGVAGYAYYPGATNGGLFFADGIIILKDYIGSIEESNPYNSRALTHEIGHYLNLSHTWGNTNDPTVACGDDGVEDTPITKGHDNCNNLYDAFCTPGIVENVQNYMEYSYCSNMFTFGQIDRMHIALQSDAGQRNNLWTDSNLVETGSNYTTTPPTCAPIADFYIDNNGSTNNSGPNAHGMITCAGESIAYKDATWNSDIISWSWEFPGGTPATSTSQNPVVTYANAGWYNATLTVTNSAGTTTKTMNNVVYIAPEWTEHVGPAMENFNTSSYGWISHNPENNHASFQHVSTVGYNGLGSMKLNNYFDMSTALPYSEEAAYYERLGGSKDYLISPAYNLSNTTNVTVSFDYAYGSQATVLADLSEVLKVYSSKDCGKTWTLRKSILTDDLITAGFVGTTDFAPTNNALWKSASFNYTASNSDDRTRFKFEYIASDLSSNLYIDNFNVSGVLGIEDNNLTSLVSLSPNPVSSGSEISIELSEVLNDMTIQVVDINGSLISTTNVAAVNGTQTIKIPMNVAQGCYFLNTLQGNVTSTHKVVVY